MIAIIAAFILAMSSTQQAAPVMMRTDLVTITRTLADMAGVEAPEFNGNAPVLVLYDNDPAIPDFAWGRYCDGQVDAGEAPGCEGRADSILIKYRTLTVNPRWGLHTLSHEYGHRVLGHNEHLAEAYACAKFPGRVTVIVHATMCLPSGDAYALLPDGGQVLIPMGGRS